MKGDLGWFHEQKYCQNQQNFTCLEKTRKRSHFEPNLAVQRDQEVIENAGEFWLVS